MSRVHAHVRAALLALLAAGPALVGCASAPREPWLTAGRPALRTPDVIPADALRLHAELSKRSFELGEPVYVRLTATNRSNHRIRVFPRLDPSCGATRVEVSPPGTNLVFPFLPLTLVDSEPPLRLLGPGESLEAVFPCFFGGNGWTFPEAGEWRLRVVYDWDDGVQRRRASTDFLPVSVVAVPGGAGGDLMQDTRASWEAGKYMTWMAGDHLVDGVQFLDAFRLAQGGTLLGSYANFFLGHYWSWYGGHPLRPPVPSKGLAYLDAADDGHLPELLRIWKGIDLGRCFLLQGNNADADAALLAGRQFAVGDAAYADLLAEIDRLLLINP